MDLIICARFDLFTKVAVRPPQLEAAAPQMSNEGMYISRLLCFFLSPRQATSVPVYLYRIYKKSQTHFFGFVIR